MASVISTMKRRLTLQWALVWLEICKLNLQTTSYTTITGDGVKTRWSVWNPTYVEEFGAIWAFWHSKGKVHHFALLPWASSSVSFGIDGTPSAPQPLLWLCPPPPPPRLCYSHQKVWPYSAISTSHLLENLLIDGWEHYGKWQESLCRWFPFEYICHLAGGGKDERQLSWTLDRLKDVCGQAGATLAGGKKQGVDDW